jgi:protocatechuate 3,4-dioxygenase beta subunit
MRSYLILIIALLPLFLSAAYAREPIIGKPCEGCESVFEGSPKIFTTRARIGAVNEPGEPMVVTGKVFDSAGKTKAGIIVYAYQTNHNGIYPTSNKNIGLASHRHGLLRAWAVTDSLGRYTFDTIRPAGYPNTDLPAHIHLHIIEPGCFTYYIDDILFKDDPRLTQAQINKLTLGRGGNGVGLPLLHEGTWQIRRDIILGKNIPGYRTCRP